MRKFTTYCTDQKTGHQIIYSECSYNMACFELENELSKIGIDIVDARPIPNGLMQISTMENGKRGRNFYYDEERGYLLADDKLKGWRLDNAV